MAEEQKTYEAEEMNTEEAYYRGQIPGTRAPLTKDNLFFRSDRSRSNLKDESDDESDVITSISGEGGAKRLLVLLANMHDSMVSIRSVPHLIIPGLVMAKVRTNELTSQSACNYRPKRLW